MNESERDAILIELRTVVRRIDAAVHGNGGGPAEGLVSRVAVLEEDMDQRKAEALALRKDVGNKDFKTLAKSGGLTVVLVAVLSAIRDVFFRG